MVGWYRGTGILGWKVCTALSSSSSCCFFIRFPRCVVERFSWKDFGEGETRSLKEPLVAEDPRDDTEDRTESSLDWRVVSLLFGAGDWDAEEREDERGRPVANTGWKEHVLLIASSSSFDFMAARCRCFSIS